MYVPQHSENVCIFRKCMYINIQKMYVPLHLKKCMYLYIQKLYVPQHSENVCISTFRKCMYLNIHKMYVPLHSENVCTSTFRKCMYLYITGTCFIQKIYALLFLTSR